MKIVSSGRVLNSREFYEKKKKRRYIKLILILIGFLAVFSLFIYLARQERFLITEIAVTEENVIDKEEIVRAVRQKLAGNYLWIIPRANAFIYPRRVIERGLLEEFLRFKSVDLNVGEQHKLLVAVEERTPFALYCADISNSEDTSKCFFLDEEGFIFAPAPSFSGAVYFIYATRNPIENPLGERFMAVEEFKLLPEFIETLAILNIHPVALEIGDDEYILFLPNGGQIIWRRDSDLALIRSNLEAFLSDDSIKAQSNFLDKISRLDLRTENKVFYTFKD